LPPFDPDASERAVRDTVDRAIDERNADLIKIYEQRAAKVNFKPAPLMTEKQLAAIADQARKRSVPVTAHHVSLESFRRIVSIGLTSLAHLPIDGPMTDQDLDLLAKSGCPVEPTMSAAYDMCWNLPGTPEQHHKALARLAEFRDRTIEPLAREYWLEELQPSVIGGIERMRKGKTRLMIFFDLSAAMRFHVGYISVGGENLRKIKDRSIPIGCGNDGGVPPCVTSMVGHELQMLDHVLNLDDTIRFNPADAVRTATLDSARAIAMADKLGSVEVGKLADLAVFDRNPLDDPTCLGSPAAAVFKQGRRVVDRMRLVAS
jgi:imidazolonepropionase-like amidohydrolase